MKKILIISLLLILLFTSTAQAYSAASNYITPPTYARNSSTVTANSSGWGLLQTSSSSGKVNIYLYEINYATTTLKDSSNAKDGNSTTVSSTMTGSAYIRFVAPYLNGHATGEVRGY